MSRTTGTDTADVLGPGPMARLFGRAVLLIGGDGCGPTRCRVLLGALKELAHEAVVITGMRADLEALQPFGVGVVEFDCGSGWHNPLREAMQAWHLARILEAENADLVHVVGFKPVMLACLAFRLTRAQRTVLHVPDLGAPVFAARGLSRTWRALTLRLLAAQLRRPTSFLLVESEDDLADLRAYGIAPGPRFAVLSGPGIDPDNYPVMPPAHADMPAAAFVGPVAEANGTPTLFRAFERVWARGVRLQLELLGEREAQGAVSREEWTRWSRHPGVRCSGAPADVREVWRRAEICVWPAQSRQGLPLPVLEAASCGRALIVSDLPGGSSSFVRDGVEGLIVPAGDTSALAAALERLARDSSLRLRLGAAGRLRLIQGYTEAHVQQTVRGAYLSLSGAGHRHADGMSST
jgi:glycosyltransferase involved in cell wall biosynthesis